MAVFNRTTKVNMEALAEAPKSGNVIPTSGVYDVTLKGVCIDMSPWDTREITLVVDIDGTTKTLYSCLSLGKDDTSGMEGWMIDQQNRAWSVFDHMCIVCGIDPNDITETETVALPIGKGGADKDMEVFTEFDDKEIKAWFKFEYYKSKTGDIKERIVLRETFTPEGLSGDEVLREETEPVRLGKLEKYIDAVSYKSDLTKEQVDEWIAAGRPSGTAGAAKAAPKPSFGKKRFGQK